VESVINFVFLTTGRLIRTLDLENPDMLGNFKIACRNFYRHRMTNVTVDHTLHEQLREIKEENEAVQEEGVRLRSIRNSAGLAYHNISPEPVVPAKRSFVDLSNDDSEVLLQGMYHSFPIQKSLADHRTRL
jgi:hypothetical protein